MRPQRLDLETALADLPDWAAVDGREAMRRSFRFADFPEAFAFMTVCAMAADRLDHHPEWLSIYSRVDVVLTTHDVGGVTGLDLELARIMDRTFAGFTSP
jgi:4a-hydroxytetrahydrobiopterin dehydratase